MPRTVAFGVSASRRSIVPVFLREVGRTTSAPAGKCSPREARDLSLRTIPNLQRRLRKVPNRRQRWSRIVPRRIVTERALFSDGKGGGLANGVVRRESA